MNKKAQGGFGALPLMGRIIIVFALLFTFLIFLVKLAEWLGLWEIPWF